MVTLLVAWLVRKSVEQLGLKKVVKLGQLTVGLMVYLKVDSWDLLKA